jgi:hypothetical protein
MQASANRNLCCYDVSKSAFAFYQTSYFFAVSDENKLLKSLPVKLRSDLLLNVYFDTLSKVYLFQVGDVAIKFDVLI